MKLLFVQLPLIDYGYNYILGMCRMPRPHWRHLLTIFQAAGQRRTAAV